MDLHQLDFYNNMCRTTPFGHFLTNVHSFTHFEYAGISTKLKPTPPATGKRQVDHRNDNTGNKKPKYNQTDVRTGMVPEPLYKLKQLVLKKVPKATLSRVLRKGGHDVQALIRSTGVPITTCCCLIFWGACPDTNCNMGHDKITLTNEAIEKAVSLIKPGATKLAGQATTQD